ncbi:MAG: archaemetzincin family Zn-dependent metalloprotease [candidate division KSB1 bacterium]|nr:archaemetzincin family Zn-dependent metalloprotease [candidate division KSB1 bacterium]
MIEPAPIYLVPIQLSNDSLLLPLSERISATFHRETVIISLPIDPSSTYEPSRNQYNSSLLLAQLVAMRPGNAHRILGVTELDLYIPILTFVFGEAQFNGPAAVVSTHRLRNEFYGLARNDQVLQERFEKEAIHELGHTFGLVHCRDDLCVMSVSTYVENIDLKSCRLCQSCLKVYQNWV